ncbi:MAG TPA: AMIN domain-containing protein [Campylobacterales bacterium]|nr:AMIN domain-containing protein [Campylobacterales bacterium]
MKHLLVSTAIIVLFSACETGYKGDCNATQPITGTTSTPASEEKPLYVEPALEKQIVEGGSIESGLAIGQIRASQKEEGVRLVLDNYQWSDELMITDEASSSVGHYRFVYDPERALMMFDLASFEEVSTQMPQFPSNSVVEKVYINETHDRLYIKLREDVKVRVFDLSNPGRIVLDIQRF